MIIWKLKKEQWPWRGQRRRPTARRPLVDSGSPPQGSSSSPEESENATFHPQINRTFSLAVSCWSNTCVIYWASIFQTYRRFLLREKGNILENVNDRTPAQRCLSEAKMEGFKIQVTTLGPISHCLRNCCSIRPSQDYKIQRSVRTAGNNRNLSPWWNLLEFTQVTERAPVNRNGQS